MARNLGNFESSEYRLALGFGVLININLLGQSIPIGLTWAEAVRKEDEDRTRNFLFDIGFGF